MSGVSGAQGWWVNTGHALCRALRIRQRQAIGSRGGGRGQEQSDGWERAGGGGADRAGLTCSSGLAHAPRPQGPAAQACRSPGMARGLAQSFRWLPRPPLSSQPQGPAQPAGDHRGSELPARGPAELAGAGAGTLTGGACLPRRLRGRVARALIAVHKPVSSESPPLSPAETTARSQLLANNSLSFLFCEAGIDFSPPGGVLSNQC